MPRLMRGILLATILSMWFSATAAEARPTALTFHLTFDKAEYKRSDPINATLSLENKGRKPIWVNKRFYITAETLPPEEHDVTLEVTGPDQQRRSCTFTYQTGFPKSDDFVLLQPGQTASAEHPRDVRGYVDFSALGTYTIVGVYENVFGEEIGLPAFRGPVKSTPVSITVTE